MIWLRVESPSTSHPLLLPPPIVLPHTRASMAMIKAATPSTYILAPRSETPPSWTPLLLPIPLLTSSPPLLLPSTNRRAHVLKVTLPPRKRLCIAIGPRFEVEECSSALTDRPTGGFRAYYGFVDTLDNEIRLDPDREIGYEITDVWEDSDEIAEEIPATDDDRLLMSGQLNSLRRDRRSHARTARLMESKARASREAWKMAPTRRTTRASPAMTTTTTPVTNAQLKALIDQGVADALTARNADRIRNGDDNYDSRTGSRRIKRTTRECTNTDFLKCQPMNSRELALMCGRIFFEESDKIEKYVGGIFDMIHGSVMASKPKTMQNAVDFATELMDKKIHTFAKHHTENKRKVTAVLNKVNAAKSRVTTAVKVSTAGWIKWLEDQDMTPWCIKGCPRAKIIKNGNKVLTKTIGTIDQPYEPTNVEEKLDKKNEMKDKGTLLMALPNKDQLKFHSYQDAKLLMEAIKKRYGGNKNPRSINNTSSTNEADNTTYRVSIAHTQVVYTKSLEKAEKVRDELKVTLEKYQNSSKSLNILLESQENVKSISDKGYHAVPSPYIGNYIPPKPDLMFIDEQLESESVDIVSTISASAIKTIESVDVKNKGVYSTIETKPVRKNNFSPPITED
uniref:Reverse transcriptase domain-containing protein n=1 Tax=Tanacetum cinerariifolium TaxID=118510 RepID=A0A699GSD9_TANCI|nr:hypothetical protein [Tanacetum cinerariifolium]